MDNNTEMYIVLACTTVFVVIMMILINIITHHKEKKFIKSIKAGDIFVYDTDVSLYYNRIENYKNNPFDSAELLVFPFIPV